MKPDEYQRLALRTEHTPMIISRLLHYPDVRNSTRAQMMDRLLHAALGICTESGELQDQLKRHWMYGKDFDKVNILEECGDILWYVALALSACGYSLEDCMSANIDKLKVRFPEAFDENRVTYRDLAAERAVLEKK